MTSAASAAPAPIPVSSAGPGRGSPAVFWAIVVTLVAWASAFVVIRAVAEDFSGGGLALGRLAVGALALGVVMIGRRWVRPTRREWLLVIVFGLSWFSVYNVALNVAEQYLDAGTTAMLVNIGPLLIALGAGLFLGEGIPRWLAIGALVAFIGVVLIGIATGSGFGDSRGVLWALAAALTYAIGVLCQKPVLRRLPAAQVTWLGCVIGAIGCLPFAGALVTELQAAPLASVLGVVYLGVVPTAIAFSTWAYALGRMPAGRLGVTTYVVPALVVLAGALLLGEIPPLLAIIGGVTCLVGVGLSRRAASSGPSTPAVRRAGETLAE
ncbi:DMT family transporter [Salinibacterium sp. SYSU T00001]|uniref:DMT family transporter n=1 Tax=Homoserinimonas sedimenticola TaxID=2986805 RepID=UPI002236B07C|nr:DMT family transporter [Salinibacterium sedimenticola]MCW4384862.1 DMT family transporter [Salinibacterium sedimenticola]